MGLRHVYLHHFLAALAVVHFVCLVRYFPSTNIVDRAVNCYTSPFFFISPLVLCFFNLEFQNLPSDPSVLFLGSFLLSIFSITLFFSSFYSLFCFLLLFIHFIFRFPLLFSFEICYPFFFLFLLLYSVCFYSICTLSISLHLFRSLYLILCYLFCCCFCFLYVSSFW